MIRRHHRVQIKRIEKLTLPTSLASHHPLPPSMAESIQRNHGSQPTSMGVLQHIHRLSGRASLWIRHAELERLAQAQGASVVGNSPGSYPPRNWEPHERN